MTWTPRAHSAALRHRAWHRTPPPPPVPRRQASAWQRIGLTWVRPRAEPADGCLAWVMPAGWPERWHGWFAEEGLPAGDHATAEQAMAAVDAQLRLEGWDT